MNLKKFIKILPLLFVVGIFPAICGQSCGGGGGGGGGDSEIPIPDPNVPQIQQLAQLEYGDVVVYSVNGVADTYTVVGWYQTYGVDGDFGTDDDYKMTTTVVLTSGNGQSITLAEQLNVQTPSSESEIDAILAADFAAQLEDPEGDE